MQAATQKETGAQLRAAVLSQIEWDPAIESKDINVAAKDPNGISVPLLMQASNDPTVLASAVDITGSTPQ